jgi:hypothetical protein
VEIVSTATSGARPIGPFPISAATRYVRSCPSAITTSPPGAMWALCWMWLGDQNRSAGVPTALWASLGTRAFRSVRERSGVHQVAEMGAL